MSELIAVPTVEQINLEHRLAFNKAGEALQHATNCGLMLLQIKASLSHGEWLPWLNGEIESGRLTVGERQARRYMQAASNRTSMSDLKYPAIQEALEIFSDKEPDTEQSTLIPVDVEAERQARVEAEARVDAERQRREAAEKVLFEEQQRCREFGKESNERRIKIRELTGQIDLLKAQPAPEPVIQTVEKIVEKPVIPPEFASLEEAIAAKQRELDRLNRDTQKVLNHNKVVYESRAALQQDVDDLTLLLSRHKAAERELVEHKRITDNVAHFCATLLVDVHTLEHAPDDAQFQRWEQAIQQLQDSAIAVRERLHYPSLEGELLEAA